MERIHLEVDVEAGEEHNTVMTLLQALLAVLPKHHTRIGTGHLHVIDKRPFLW